MRKLYKIKLNNDFKISPNLVNFLNPDYIYLPFRDNSLIEEKIDFNIGDIVTENKNEVFSSSISGQLKHIEQVTLNNKTIAALIIENNFKENKIKNPTKEINNLDDFLSYIKEDKLYNKLNKKNVKQIIINAIEDEPYSLTERFLLKKNTDKILDSFDFLNILYNTEKNLVVLKNNELDNITTLLNKIGTYHNVNLVILKDQYLIGNEKFLLEKLNYDYSETIVLSPKDIMDIINYVDNGYSSNEKYLTIVNFIDNKIKVLNVKKYVKLSELSKHIPYNKDYVYIKNGLLSGLNININNEIIDDTFNSIFILNKEEQIEEKCINCGKCYQVCPLKINPKYRMDSKTYSSNCIDCGLCSYFCPSNINLRKYLKKENKNE